ncbi:MAG: lysophospholipid acyltransferase family protein [Mariprofundaceae bacterium]
MKLVRITLRVILTAYGFVQFATQVLWLSKWVMPRIMAKDQAVIEKRMMALLQAHKHVELYLATLDRLGLISFNFIGTPIKEPALVVANHPCLLDFIILLKDFPNAVCLFKKQTRENPVLSDFVEIAAYIEGMDGTRETSKKIIESCCERWAEGHHVVVFPEGTRSQSNTMPGKFRSTVFHAAVKAGVKIQPVAIYCRPLFLGKNQAWMDFPKSQNHVTIEYLEPISPAKLTGSESVPDYTLELIKQKLLQLDAL